MKVLIPNHSFHDFTDATRFGELVFMSEGRLNPLAINDMVRQFTPFIEASSPEDWLLQSSLTIMNMVAAGMFASKHGRLNLLIFQVGRDEKGRYQEGKYEARTVIFTTTKDKKGE